MIDPFMLAQLDDDELYNLACGCYATMGHHQSKPQDYESRRVMAILAAMERPYGEKRVMEFHSPRFHLPNAKGPLARLETDDHYIVDAVFVRALGTHSQEPQPLYTTIYGPSYTFPAVPKDIEPLGCHDLRHHISENLRALQARIKEEEKYDPFNIANWSEVTMFDHVSRILLRLGDPREPQFRKDTVIVVQGLPIARDADEERNIVVHRSVDLEFYTHAVTIGVAQIKKYNTDEDELPDLDPSISQEGIKLYGSYRMAATSSLVPEVSGDRKRGNLQLMTAFARDEWFGAKEMYATPDPFGMLKGQASLGYNNYQPMAKRWNSFYLDRPTQHIAGLTGNCQICLIGDPIPQDILAACALTTNPSVTIRQDGEECLNELNYGIDQQVVAYRSHNPRYAKYTADIPEERNLSSVAVYSFKPPHLKDVRSTKIPIDLDILHKQIENELQMMKVKAQLSSLDPFGVRDATDDQLREFAHDLLEIFRNRREGTKLVPNTITLICSTEPGKGEKNRIVPFRKSRNIDNETSDCMVSHAVLIEPAKDTYKTNDWTLAKNFTTHEQYNAVNFEKTTDLDKVKGQLLVALQEEKMYATLDPADPMKLKSVSQDGLLDIVDDVIRLLTPTTNNPSPPTDVRLMGVGHMNRQDMEVWQKRRVEFDTRTQRPMIVYPKVHHRYTLPNMDEPDIQAEQNAAKQATSPKAQKCQEADTSGNETYV